MVQKLFHQSLRYGSFYVYNSTRAIAWGTFPLPVETSEPEIWLF